MILFLFQEFSSLPRFPLRIVELCPKLLSDGKSIIKIALAKNFYLPVVQKKILNKFSLVQFVLKLFYPETKSFYVNHHCKTLEKLGKV